MSGRDYKNYSHYNGIMGMKKIAAPIVETCLKERDILLPLCISIVLSLSIYCNDIVIFIFPIVPAIYGWKTRNILGSILMGILPISFLFIELHIINLSNYTPERLNYVITYFAKLIAVGGIEGYLAAKLPKQYFVLLLIIGSFLWYSLFISGID